MPSKAADKILDEIFELVKKYRVDRLKCRAGFIVVTPGGAYELSQEEFIEFCANTRDGKGAECFADAKSKAVKMLKDNENWLPDAY